MAKTIRGEPSRIRARGVVFTKAFGFGSRIQEFLDHGKRIDGDHPGEVRRGLHVAAIHGPKQRRKPLRIGMVHVRMTIDKQRCHIVTAVKKRKPQRIFRRRRRLH